MRVKTWSLEDPQMTMIDADVYGLTYKATYDGTCTWEGKTEKLPASARTATVWVRSGDKWQPVFHGENPIIDPKNPPPPPAKPEDKKDEAKPADKPASNSNSSRPPPHRYRRSHRQTPTRSWRLEKSGWEAWKAKDVKKLEELTAKNLSILTGEGTVLNRADTIKYWTEMPCENVKSVGVTDGFGTALSPAVEMLSFKGTADGTCYGQKNGPQDGVSVYVKEGDAWKLAFAFMKAPMLGT